MLISLNNYNDVSLFLFVWCGGEGYPFIYLSSWVSIRREEKMMEKKALGGSVRCGLWDVIFLFLFVERYRQAVSVERRLLIRPLSAIRHNEPRNLYLSGLSLALYCFMWKRDPPPLVRHWVVVTSHPWKHGILPP